MTTDLPIPSASMPPPEPTPEQVEKHYHDFEADKLGSETASAPSSALLDVAERSVITLPVKRHLEVVPVMLEEANAFIRVLHRHHKEVVGARLCFGIGYVEGAVVIELVGVGIAGRPIAKGYQNGWTLEVTRGCTDGSKNANSMIYGAAWRAAKAIGYRRLITYTRKDESGASLRAAGWRIVAELPARSWAKDSKKRIRVDKSEPAQRVLWEAV